MTNYPTLLKNLLKKSFSPGSILDYDLLFTNQELLSSLNTVFPLKAITDYELTDCLQELGYECVFIENSFKWMFKLK